MISLPAPYPLTWPENKPRTPAHRRQVATYAVHGYAEAMMGLERELARWQRHGRAEQVIDWQVTATHAGRGRPDNLDPGASLWFVLGGKDVTASASLMVIACDKFRTLPHNLRALSLTMERLRLVADVGAYSLVQAVEGARALPPPAKPIDWRKVLSCDTDVVEVAEAVYRAQALKAGEGSDRIKTLNLAIAEARKELSPGKPGPS